MDQCISRMYTEHRSWPVCTGVRLVPRTAVFLSTSVDLVSRCRQWLSVPTGAKSAHTGAQKPQTHSQPASAYHCSLHMHWPQAGAFPVCTHVEPVCSNVIQRRPPWKKRILASKIYRDIKPVLFNPIGNLQFCMANGGIPTDRVQTHIGPVWEGMRTVWIRELMGRDEETKSCHSDHFPAAPFKHLRHLSPSLMLPNFDFLLLMRLYIQIAPFISFSVCVFMDGSNKSQPKHFKTFLHDLVNSGKCIWLSKMDTVRRAVTAVVLPYLKSQII